MRITDISKNYKICLLADPDVEDVYQVCKSNREFYKLMHTHASNDSIMQEMRELPPGKTFKDKYYLGFYKETGLTAIANFVVGFPDRVTVMLDLFMVTAEEQGKGIGGDILEELAAYLKKQGYKRMRTGCVVGNDAAKKFWEKHQFVETSTILAKEKYQIQPMIRVL